jgi:hypothetical protein
MRRAPNIDIEALIKKHFADLKGIEDIYTVQEGPVTHVWTVLCSDARSVEDAVFEREGRLLDDVGKHPLDFHTVLKGGRPLEGKPLFLRSVTEL